jgi:hypothetical protein
MTVLVTFVGSNLVQAESGLLTVTLMGVLLANQKWISIKHIIEFKENLRVLLIASLFIILAARLQVDDLQYISWNSLFFLLTLIFVIRPISIFLSTIKSGLSWKEKLFLSWMAPRGIVAAAVTSVFALELVEHGYPEAARLVPEMFVVIVGTVAIYGLSAAAVGRWLGVAQPDPQGVLIAGAHPWAREIGLAVQEAGYKVMLVDTNWANLNAARLEGLPTFYASILSEYVMDKIELGSLGRLLALTPNDEVNSLAVLHFTEVFERAEVYQLPPKETNHNRKETISQPLRGRLLFAPHATYAHLTERFKHTEIKKTGLTEKFTYEMFKDRYGERALPLFLIKANGNLIIFTASNEVFPKGGDTLISLIDPIEEPEDELVERFAGNPVYVKFK